MAVAPVERAASGGSPRGRRRAPSSSDAGSRSRKFGATAPATSPTRVGDVLRAGPATAAPDESATGAWERMRELGVEHLVVLHQGEVVGVLSAHHLSGPFGGVHRRMGRRVADLMTTDVVTVSPSTDLRRAARLMRSRRVGCLPVVARGRLVGALTTADLLALLERLLRLLKEARRPAGPSRASRAPAPRRRGRQRA